MATLYQNADASAASGARTDATADATARTVARAIVARELHPILVDELDSVLGWILDNSSAFTLALNKVLEPQLALDTARHRTVKLLGTMLFSRSRSCWDTLGLARTSDADVIKRRYRRLVQVYHPDRALADTEWLGRCTQQLTEAHDTCVARIQSAPVVGSPVGKVEPPKPRKSATRDPAKPKFQLRRTLQQYLGSASTLRRRILFGLLCFAGLYLGLLLVGFLV